MNKKIKLAILFGGKSAEHSVSIKSAKNIFDALDKGKYEIFLIKINKNGEWFLMVDQTKSWEAEDAVMGEKVVFIPGSRGDLYNIDQKKIIDKVEVVFPVLHGPFGEDGTVQGLLKIADVPFVGADVLGSAIGMDKEVMKRLLIDASLDTADYIVLRRSEFNEEQKKYFDQKISFPCFVKPANLGSSVGISKVKDETELQGAIDLAFNYDKKVIIEKNIIGREIECAVLGNSEPQASVAGEIIATKDFYSYEAKYINEDGAILKAPAELSELEQKNIQKFAIKVFQILECRGLARVDFFLCADGKIFVNEINTLPGFTAISMYPRLWGLSGITYPDLIDRIIQLAFKAYQKDSALRVE